MWRLLLVFAILVLYKVISNAVRYRQVKHYLVVFERHLKEPSWEMDEAKLKVIALLKGAGVQDAIVPVADVVLPGLVRRGKLSVFNNLPTLRDDVYPLAGSMLHQAMGVYRGRVFEALNPLYWIELALNLPRHVVGYLGVPAQSVLTRVLSVIYWLGASIFTVVYALYKPEVDAAIKALIARLIP